MSFGVSLGDMMSIRRLTKMYSETKKSYETVTGSPKVELPPEMAALHRKLRIQKDRLIAWGLEWSDADASQPGDIDASLEKEGVSDIVGSVLTSIKGILKDAERLGQGGSLETKASWEKKGNDGASSTRWTTADKPQFEDLIKDLTTSIDILYDLSRTRRDLRRDPRGQSEARKSYPSYAYKNPPQDILSPDTLPTSPHPGSTSSSYPSTPREILSAASLRLDRASLILPGDNIWPSSSTPYPHSATTSSTNQRTMGYIRRPHVSTNPWKLDGGRLGTIPVLIEYAPFDSVYSSTGIHLPLDHLEELASILHWPDLPLEPPLSATLNFLGYFGDENHSRYGMVYELPRDVYRGPEDSDKALEALTPFSLHSILKGEPRSPSAVPCLENRFRAAHNLTSALADFCLRGQVHGNLSSSNILLFSQTQKTSSLGSSQDRSLRSPYLASFDVFSEYDIERHHTLDRNEALYHHPNKSNGPEQKRLLNAFDMYGLGLILLELGLWMPLKALCKETYDMETFKIRLQGPYTKALLPKCGRIYMRAVQICLSAPEQLSIMGGDSNWELLRIYQEVLQRLKRCCAIDEEDDDDDDDDEDETNSVDTTTDLNTQAKSQKTVRYAQNESEVMTPLTNDPDAMDEDPAEVSGHSFDSSNAEPMTPVSVTEEPTRKPIVAKPKLKAHPLKISQAELNTWHDTLLPRLEKLLTRALKESYETATIDLISIGETPAFARPTIFVTCTSVGKVKSILSRKLTYDKTVFDLKVRRGKVRRSGAKRALSRRSSRGAPKRRGQVRRSGADRDEEDWPVMNPHHQERPLCGASIGAYRNEEHLPPVSYGGVVLVDGEPYGMTVHHLLEEPSDDESDWEVGEYATRSSAQWYADQRIPGFEGQDSWLPNMEDTGAFVYEISDDDDIDSAYDDDYDEPSEGEDEDSDLDEEGMPWGDTPGIIEGQGDDLIITQPAIDDVHDDFFPNEDDRDEEHLDSHTLGCVHASSGVRRLKRDGVKHEVDWALMRIDDNRLQPHNLVQGGRRYSKHGGALLQPKLAEPVCRQPIFSASEDLYPVVVADAGELGRMQVHCVGRTSGLQGGIISPAMSAVKVFGRKSYSRSWSVMGGFGVGGDSGAWVIDNEHGQVCGHVLAWCDKNAIAYICPMDILLEDIAKTLGATSVGLPGGEMMDYDEDDIVDIESLHISRAPSMNSTGASTTSRKSTDKELGDLQEIFIATGPIKQTERQVVGR